MMGLLATLVLIGPITAHAQNARGVKAPIDAGVAHVESGGLWRDRGERGHYRAVTHTRCSPEHCYDTLDVDWVAIDSGRMRIVTTKAVSEVGDLTSITEVKFVVSKTDTRLQVKHETLGGDDRWTKCLTLGAPGKYVVKDGACGKAG